MSRPAAPGGIPAADQVAPPRHDSPRTDGADQAAGRRGYGPDSVYAGWSDEERAAADRAEDDDNRQTRCQLAELVHSQYVRVAGDDSLRDLATLYRRELEDVASGRLVGGDQRARVVRARLSEVERAQECRAALASAWLAAADGTHCYTAFAARGGLDAVRNHAAPPPSYHLATMLDRRNALRELPHVLAWAPAPLSAGSGRADAETSPHHISRQMGEPQQWPPHPQPQPCPPRRSVRSAWIPRSVAGCASPTWTTPT